MVSWAQVLAFAPELSSVNPTVSALILQCAHEFVPASEFCGADYTLAQIYLAAHMASLHVKACGESGGAGSTQGPVASESIGGLSISYRNGYGVGSYVSREGYERTPYGMAYLELLRASRCGSAGLGFTVL